METELSAKDMRDLTDGQFAALRELNVSEYQEVLGKSFLESIDDWENASPGTVLGLCFFFADQPVGLTLFRRSEPSGPCAASIHGLKIATPWQGRGWGRLAFRLAVENLKKAWPETEKLVLAVDADNAPAIAVYRGFGMNDSGPVFEGPNGKEHRMEITLST